MITHLLLHTMATPDLAPSGAVALAANLGFDGIELIIDDHYRCALAARPPVADLRELQEAADRHGAAVRMVCSYPADLSSSDDAERRRGQDHVLAAIDIAEHLGSRGVRVLAGRRARITARDQSVGLLVDSLAALTARASEAHVDLLLENHMDTLATSAANTRQIVDLVAHDRLGIVLDPANLAIMNAEDPLTAIDIQSPLIRHLHIKNFALEDTQAGRIPVDLTDGVVSWSAVLKALHGFGYQGPATFEYERRWFPDIPSAAQASGQFMSMMAPWRSDHPAGARA